jgi:hypothetical protein
MEEIVPTDTQFEEAFATARVSKGYLARYYLRAIDKTMADDPDPEFVANEDYDATNLEHIIPINPDDKWPLTAEEAASAQTLVGNLTLLSSKKNVALGNVSFGEKMEVYKESSYLITNMLERYGDNFGLEQVKARQAELAAYAVKTWPLTFA